MGKTTETKYSCDRCGKRLPTFNNHIVIQTNKNGDDDYRTYWERFRVTIEYHHGVHNNGERGPADLCQPCAVALLTDALKRVKDGERLSEGVESSHMLKFNEAF